MIIVPAISKRTYYFTSSCSTNTDLPVADPEGTTPKQTTFPRPHSQIIIDLLFGNCAIYVHAATRFFFKALAQNFRTPLDLDRDPFRLSSIYTYIASLLRNLYLPPHRALHQTNPCSSGIHTPFEVILICKVGHLTSPHANSNRDLPRP